MKILRKPKLLPIGCKRCGCLFQAKLKNLVACIETKAKDGIPCPFCKTINKARFDMPKSEDIDDEQIN